MSFSLGRRCPPGRMRGKKKCFCLALNHRLRRSPLSRMTRVMLDDGFCDSAFGSAQNDRVGIGISDSFRIRETKLKDIYYFKIFHWFFEHWFCLALCSLFFIDVIWISLLFFAEGKLEKDELIVNDYYLKECESVKNTNFVLSSHRKIKYDRMVPIKPMR